ncbi:hypothetical protein TELCIR_23712 [Teladorsagia circumcincta]|uniref:Uncharacterized protein n=1 Tax=Teladorsagia circumcincta TaxID=45464 RepID=A0A2G9TAB7_TELCI|nr:hypothetical protein TELCIR_23712 [Teladorsagia circumcincta]
MACLWHFDRKPIHCDRQCSCSHCEYRHNLIVLHIPTINMACSHNRYGTSTGKEEGIIKLAYSMNGLMTFG